MTAARYLPEYEAKRLVCELSRLLATRGLLGGELGSVSIRCARDAAWITPAEGCPEFMNPDKLARIAFRREAPRWGRQPSPLTPTHAQAYLAGEGVAAVITTAPPYLPVLLREGRLPPGAALAPDGSCLVHTGGDPYQAYASIREMDDAFKRAFFERRSEFPGLPSGAPQAALPADPVARDEQREKDQVIRMITARVTELILTRLQLYRGENT